MDLLRFFTIPLILDDRRPAIVMIVFLINLHDCFINGDFHRASARSVRLNGGLSRSRAGVCICRIHATSSRVAIGVSAAGVLLRSICKGFEDGVLDFDDSVTTGCVGGGFF